MTMDPTTSTAVAVRGLRKSYDRQTTPTSTYAVDGVSFDVPRGEFLTLLGPSGCGKTTTLRCIAGLEHATEGQIEMAGRTVFDAAAKTNVRSEDRPIAMVPQSYGIWPHMTVFDNAAFPMRHGRNRRRGQDIKARATEVLEQVGLAPMADRWATQLSGGQQQRLALARALLGDPEVLLLDEPLSNLDAKLRVSLRQELRAFQERFGVTAVYVTHDQSEALALSDTVIVMNGGRIEQIDPPDRLYNYPRTVFVADFIGSANLLPVQEAFPSGGSMIAQTAVGAVHCARPTPDQVGQRQSGGFVCVRPENIDVRPINGKATADDEFIGRIESAEFLGDRLELVIQVADTKFKVAARADLGCGPGEDVVVHLDPSSTSYLAS